MALNGKLTHYQALSFLDFPAAARLQGPVLDLRVCFERAHCPARQAANVRRRVALPGVFGVYSPGCAVKLRPAGPFFEELC
jgi:hypothetical protein